VLLCGIWAFASVGVLNNLSRCLTHLGGTTCYNEAGTAIGLTPDTFGSSQMTRHAQEQALCNATLTAIPSNNKISPRSIVIVPYTFVGNRPALNLSSREGFFVSCGQQVELLSELKRGDGLWYEIKVSDRLSGWIRSTDGIAIPNNMTPVLSP
jgi:hypothetical protein